mmetsp:Transcript_16325/g.23620  ORF Transcript_16325/g.23620 Transcript_16325/m.23620 type:complete len:93 (-) Transcript_16325:782-1060(-)|eukprot:CAMPEP_0184742366 /NCGR_PEP_ID=MMETSP0315-20130426/5301_1 /TAXON_ID=101924 /ORGANISM="Rhodosorus marinus, Strain UTEX LB 2760" /LENGTH=92 /DNA_ID=CAMNT_0027213125 /DNA_START=151 /DNA_END=429 /DNA_ORIENTATION=+
MSVIDKSKCEVKAEDITEEMKEDAFALAVEALEKFTIEKDIAAFLKREFDKKHQPTWHCVVGKSFGSYVTHETRRFIYFYVGNLAVLLFKSG